MPVSQPDWERRNNSVGLLPGSPLNPLGATPQPGSYQQWCRCTAGMLLSRCQLDDLSLMAQLQTEFYGSLLHLRLPGEAANDDTSSTCRESVVVCEVSSWLSDMTVFAALAKTSDFYEHDMFHFSTAKFRYISACACNCALTAAKLLAALLDGGNAQAGFA